MSKSTIIAEKPVLSVMLDDKDLAILRILQQNARATVREIAVQVKLST
ncbi:MAG: AsnC family protein, partial [Chitinophagaceae bacterium]|nr:AsnC family protein [Chitinophagaceae bacterium]